MTNPRARAVSPAFVCVRSSVMASRSARISSTRSWSSHIPSLGRVPPARRACSRSRPSSHINLPSPLSSAGSTSTWDDGDDPARQAMSARSSSSSALDPSGGAVLPFLFPRRSMGATALWVANRTPPSADVCSLCRPKRADLVDPQADERRCMFARADSGTIAARSVADGRPICRQPRGPSRESRDPPADGTVAPPC